MTRTAWLSMRDLPHYRRDAFEAGLKRLGFRVHKGLPNAPVGQDLMLCWNRYGQADRVARLFEKRGLPVIVVENGYLGNEMPNVPGRWYAMSLNHHNGGGKWPTGGPERWASFHVELRPWRTEGSEVVALPQRGIGPPGIAMPPTWTRTAQKIARVRKHPGTHEVTPLERDLKNARAVVTWGSGAALKALTWGIPVFHSFKHWIGAPASRRLEHMDKGPVRDDAARLAMFERLAWAQAEVAEITSGDAIARLLAC